MEEKCIPKDETYLGLKINARSFGEKFPNSKEKRSRQRFLQSDKKKNEKKQEQKQLLLAYWPFSLSGSIVNV